MPTDFTSVRLHLDGGPLLVEAVRTAVRFQAAHAGLDEETSGRLANASDGVCREALLQLTDGDPGLDVLIDTFADRIEVSIHHRGQLVPAVGLEAFAHSEGPQGSSGVKGAELLAQVDRVMFNSEGGVARTTLLKFLHPKP